MFFGISNRFNNSRPGNSVLVPKGLNIDSLSICRPSGLGTNAIKTIKKRYHAVSLESPIDSTIQNREFRVSPEGTKCR